MSKYMTKAAAQQSLSTWNDFVDVLKVNYRTLNPDKDAQQHLKEICTKTYPTMVSFTEKFHQWATKTNLGHTALIGYITEHRDKDVHQAMVTRDSLGIADPTTWPEYLDLYPNAMDVDRVFTLTKEQEGWLEKKLCQCPDPKYKGKFEMPKRGQATRAISTTASSTSFDDSKAREEAAHAFITSYNVKGKEREAELEPAVKAARITEVKDDEDFLRRVL
ncbi:uncharacterized protein LAESUDRAFT_755841 [Laetiporus sulphureus 93-53]|uniref:Uncharacterized protein n=1 Tax=Laetiporus sulphureus 93-53 TaxID=1314785 RepID=A0A165GH24_9APHY|nr:uncharacterized protein LAESUDRAFT_755841 [Laetiporus sulphureus 93-53]KZT10337.1 hypothetical protein LAESUDRAFT_755841 [Laetiporus sulphureus 93-53]